MDRSGGYFTQWIKSEKDKYCMYVESKKQAKYLTRQKQTFSQLQRKNLVVVKGEGVGGLAKKVQEIKRYELPGIK